MATIFRQPLISNPIPDQRNRRSVSLLTFVYLALALGVPSPPPATNLEFADNSTQGPTYKKFRPDALQGTGSSLALRAPPTAAPSSQDDWPVPKARADVNRGFTVSFSLPLQTIRPNNQRDWPNPRGYAPLNRGWTDSFKLPLQTIEPNNQYDWPVPKGKKSVEGFTLESLAIDFAAAVRPINQYDWPLPNRGAQPLNRGFADSFKLPLQTIEPANQYDWPVPRGAKGVAGFTQESLAIDFAAAVRPINQYEWPVPSGSQPLNRGFADSFKLALQTIVPNNQYDWPNPRGAKPVVADWQQGTPYTLTVVTVQELGLSAETVLGPYFAHPSDTGFTDSGLALATFVAQAPFVQEDWPNPRGYDRAVDLRTWLQTGYLEEVGEPFRQADWPVPQPPRRLSGLSWTDSFKLPLTRPTAGNQKDWPNPRGYQRSIELLTWTRPALQVVPQQGFNQFDWPVPKGWGPRQDWIKGTPASNLGSLKPFKRDEWPVPPGPKERRPDWVRGSEKVLTFTFAPPFAQSSWPVPKGPSRGNKDAVLGPSLNLVIASLYKPFLQSDWPNPLPPRRLDISFFYRKSLALTDAVDPLQPVTGYKFFASYRGFITTGPNIVLPNTAPPVPPQPPVSHKPPKSHHGAAQSGAGLAFVRSGTAQTGVTSGKSRADVRGKNEQAEAASGTSKSDAQDP